ncbi:MAG TPA: hypothetical protein VFJ90_09125, partial [Candidatus Didemnitutus sp.]|nr:hypothetical protein [Candidatus Didemnitutus sp.]
MKPIVLSLIAALTAGLLVAEPTVRDQVTEVLAHSDSKAVPPPTAKEMSQRLPPKRGISIADSVVTLPDYEVTAPRVIPNQAKIELDLAKNQVAVRQEEAQLKATETDKGLNPGSCSYEVGPV